MNSYERHDFESRIAAYQDGGLDDEQLIEFEVEMREDPAKLNLFIRVHRQTGAMVELFRNEAVRHPDEKSSGNDVILYERPDDREKAWQRPIWMAVAVASIAASLLWVWSLRIPNDQPEVADLVVTPNPAAEAKTATKPAASNGMVALRSDGPVITYSDQTEWSDGQSRNIRDRLDYDQPYRLLSGTARLRMEGGAILSIGAPAEFRIVDSVTMEFVSGRLTARLPDEQSDLKVITNELQVHDLGTAFGLTVQANGQVDVAVFDGAVSAHLNRETDPTAERTFSQGEAFSADSLGNRLSKIAYNPESYQDIWPLTVGINEISDLIEFVPPGFAQPLSSLTNDDKLFLVAERLNCAVEKDFRVGLLGAGLSWPITDRKRKWVTAGNVVNSYLLMFQPDNIVNDLPVSVSGSITFQNRILGVAVSPRQLSYTNKVFGLPGLDYSQFAWRRLENIDTDDGRVPADMLKISEDGRQLRFHLHASTGTDHIRVIVDESSSDLSRTSDGEEARQH